MRAALLLFAAPAAGLDLTPANWDAETQGKSVFIKFLAPWGYPQGWGQHEFQGCMMRARLCHACRPSPCGDPADLKTYEGGRDAKSLKQHVEDNLGADDCAHAVVARRKVRRA
eukprot:gene21822-39470_t